MSRFDDIDLSQLGPLPLGTDTYASLKQARLGLLVERLVFHGFSYDVDMLETDPLVVANAEAGAARELLMLSRRDDAIRAVLLTDSWGPFLDALGATQIPPVQRKVMIPADPVAGTAAVMEEDDDYRRRVQLAPEALSTCGPEGAYLFFATDETGAKAALPIGPMSFGGDYDTPFIPHGCIHIPIVAATGDGTASPELVAQVQAAVSPTNRRPMADFVTVMPAIIVPYAIKAIIYVGQGPDREEVRKRALARLFVQAQRQHRSGAAQRLRMLYGAASVPDANGRNLTEDVELISPAADVNGMPITVATPQAAYRAPYCTGIEVEVRLADDA